MDDSMKVAVLHGIHDIRIEERPVPRPAPDEVLIRVSSVGTCGSDVHYYEHGRIGDFVVEQPLVLGHEPSGVVVARGRDAHRHEIGARVALEPGVPCSVCAECKAGRYNLCPRMRFFGTPPVDGAFCEYVVLREDFAHPVPDTLSDDAAALLEPLSVGVWASRKSRIAPGSRVLITGAGPIGLVATQTARAFGASEVVVTDVNPRRLRVAEELGATGTIDVSRDSLADAGFTPDVLLECSGVPAAAAQAIRTVGRAGRVVLVGMGGDELPLPLSHVQNSEIEVTGTFRYANTWPTAIALAAGEVDLDALVTHRFGLDEVEQALTVAAKDDSVIKAVVRA
ncbi:NAD(P)-dependent alcohol dehydrogenase [Amycolatopsis thermophila]|uniref:L-iditol 2-dehydrogenase n=1 Tax=Amycolatopsis thermophila TaxID=206084 RepID=A0ABU0EQR5_9PSEU|nr:NAD(P)-dependent alcohol dehydrogenase [Amycolatopsis thermophila]MDQ0377499.1 L-iditol 2-dehydrogenase [Amycolatopsis thermophila]